MNLKELRQEIERLQAEQKLLRKSHDSIDIVSVESALIGMKQTVEAVDKYITYDLKDKRTCYEYAEWQKINELLR